MKPWPLVFGLLLFLSANLAAQTSMPLVSMLQAPQTELGKWWKNSDIVGRLQLSKSQAMQIEQCFLKHQPQLARLNSDLKRQEAALGKLMRAEPINEAAIHAQMANISAARAALESTNSSMMLAMRKVLSLEQWIKLESMRQVTIHTTGENGVRAPRIIRMPKPQYTQSARDARIEGVVTLQVVVRKDGSVDSFKILRGLGFGLDESAMDTIAKEWRFEPGTKDGQPVDVQANIDISFRLY